jgi:hypothetical protein
MWRASIVLLLALPLLGCRTAYPPHLVIGPFRPDARAQLWEQTLAAVREAHYEPELSDPNLGRIIVPSHVFGSRERFMIQLYREGWIQVGLVNQLPVGWQVRIPAELGEEQIALTMGLREHLAHAWDAAPSEAAPSEAAPSEAAPSEARPAGAEEEEEDRS